MRTKSILFLLSILLIPAVLHAASDEVKENKCLTVHQTPIAVFIEPTHPQIESMKKENGDDFYTIADDAMYYESEATDFLNKMGFPYCFSESAKHEFKVDQISIILSMRSATAGA